MSKKVSFGKKPKVEEEQMKVDNWINDKEETIRYTIDLPLELHAKIKYKCALKRSSMKGEILTLLEKHFS